MDENKAIDGTSESSWIDDEYLQSILRRDENDASLIVVDSHIERAVPVGDNYISVLVRVTVDYTIKEGTIKKSRSIIVKSPPNGEILLEFTQAARVFERELHIYAFTLPAMNKIYEERTGESYQAGPKYLLSDHPDTITMDDLRPLGYKMSDRRKGLDYHHIETAMKTLAKFHATSMVLHEKEPALIEYYKEANYTPENRRFHADFMEPTFRSLAGEVERWPGFERFGDKLRKFADDAVDNIITMRNEDTVLKVLNHGDFWTNNMLFRYNDDGKIADIKMLDFQLIAYTTPAVDIIYLLYTSPKQAVLEEFEDALIGEYLKEFNNTLKRLDCHHLLITRDQLNKEISDYGYYAVFTSMMFCVMIAEPEAAPKFDMLTNENKNELASVVMNKAFSGKTFRNAFEKRLVKFEQQGLI